MKRKQLFFLEMIAGVLLLVIAATVMVPKFIHSQNLNHPNIFPDENFRTKIAYMLRKNQRERFTRSELLTITEMDIGNINDITGIRVFKNLERLSVTFRNLTELTLPKLSKLIELDCSSNEITSIEISKCKNLEVLDISGNAINEFTVEDFPYLRELNCSSNLLKQLDLTTAPNLEWLDCSNNLLKTIDTSNNPLLDSIYCSMNLISELDLSKNPRLTKLTGWENPLVELDVSHNPLLQVLNMSRCELNEIDFTHNHNLEVVVLSSNYLTDLPNIPFNEKLRMLYIDMNQLTDDDWSDVQRYWLRMSFDNRLSYEYSPQKTGVTEFWNNTGAVIYSASED